MILNNYDELNYTHSNIEYILKKAVNEATEVYVFRRLNHFEGKPEIIDWIDEQKSETLDCFTVEYSGYNQKVDISSSDNSKILKLKFDEKNKVTFSKLFKVSIDMLSNIQDCTIIANDFFVLDPLYDQFDYIFVKDNNVILITDIHPFVFVYDKVALCKK